MILRHPLVLVLAALHLLQASWLLEGGIDLLRRAPAPVAAAEQRCAPHGCGCEESAKIRGACCCGPASESAPGSALLAALKCRGAADDDVPLLTQVPAVASFPFFSLLPSSTEQPAFPVATPDDAASARRVDKVPIA